MSNKTAISFQRFSTIAICLGFIFLFSTAYISTAMAAPLGCCEKIEKNDPTKKSYMNATTEECTAAGATGFWEVTFDQDAIAFNNIECKKKPIIKPREFGAPVYITPTITIPDSNFTSGQGVKIDASTTTIANYIVAIFKYSIGVIGIIAAIVLMIAGILWLTAGGNHEQIGNAKKMIGGSLVGMFIAFGAFILLSAINTNLVNLKISNIPKIQYLSIDQICALKTAHDGTTTSANMAKEECENIRTTQVDPNNPEAFSKVDCLANYVASANRCVPDELGCCQVTIVDWSIFGIIESDKKDAYCLNNLKEKDCEERSSPFWRSFPGTSIWSQFSTKNMDTLDKFNDKFSTTFHSKKCQEVPECTSIKNGQTY